MRCFTMFHAYRSIIHRVPSIHSICAANQFQMHHRDSSLAPCAHMQCIPFIGSYMSHINLRLFSYSSMLGISLHHVSPIHKLSILLLVIIYGTRRARHDEKWIVHIARRIGSSLLVTRRENRLSVDECTANPMGMSLTRNGVRRASALAVETCALSSGQVWRNEK